ncbi:hypothetical protein BU23DRAFT_372434, partial [Bimuria novae-zelandiae CBS 107.79]
EKSIHSIIIDTGPLIKNDVSISTIINSAEILYTTPAIIVEIRDPATRSRVETTLLPFLNIKTPTPASFEAVVEFSKKTGDFPVLSKQDLGILALAYEVHCEKNGGSFGLRSVPKGLVKLKPGDEEKQNKQQEKVDMQKAAKEAKEAKKRANVAKFERRTEERKQKKKDEKAAARAKADGKANAKEGAHPVNASEGGIQLSEEPAISEDAESKPVEEPVGTVTQSPEQPVEEATAGTTLVNTQAAEEEPVQDNDEESANGGVQLSDVSPAIQESEQIQVIEDVQQPEQDKGSENTEQPEQAQLPEQTDNAHNTQVDEQTQQTEQTQEPGQPRGEEQMEEPETHLPENTQDFEKVPQKKLHPAKARLARRAAERDALAASDPLSTFPTQQPTPPTSDSESDGGEWITPSNLSQHQTQDPASTPLRAGDAQLPVATMTTDYAMQNVLLQMGLPLLSPSMQRIRHARSTILRCHACFLLTRETDRQFCPRCGQPTLTRVACSTNAATGEFQIHLSARYQHNKRGDKYSIPKPVGGTSNGKMRGKGGGKGGWGRELVLSEDQKEFQRSLVEQGRRGKRDLMDEEVLPGILTGERAVQEGRVKVGAGRNVNSRKR